MCPQWGDAGKGPLPDSTATGAARATPSRSPWVPGARRSRRATPPAPDDVLTSTISVPGGVPTRRIPAYANTHGYDSDVFDLGAALRRSGDQLGFRLVAHRDAAWAGALLVAVDAQG
ncbi:hypothetical protein I3F55_16965 [Streptomyces sp. MUM 16J]|nr:hypothetical protein [Streptomyces sp. MUM 16J]